jgi:hypothetical protein
MEYIIERVARFADIDTRRAMGFPPRKLTSSNIVLPQRFLTYGSVKIIFDRGIRFTLFYYEGANQAVCWSFGCGGPPWEQRGYVFRSGGRIEIYNDFGKQDSWHPDFNEDGSFIRGSHSVVRVV